MCFILICRFLETLGGQGAGKSSNNPSKAADKEREHIKLLQTKMRRDIAEQAEQVKKQQSKMKGKQAIPFELRE